MLTALGFNWMRASLVASIAALGLFAGTAALAADAHTTGKFEGVKANMGTATHSKENGMHVLTLSSDFVIPDAPAPHWQVVDSKGNTYLLQRLVIKGDVFHNRIVVPSYVKDIAKVQIWCAYAEVLLGEAKFEKPVI
ncbi:MAG: hypothetical protein ACKVU1_16145 [bacterium]